MSRSTVIDTYPLAPMQQGMLFHHLLGTHPGADLEQIVVTMPEELDLPAFQRAWQVVVGRHPVLRTSFRWEGLDAPLQDVHATVEPPWELHDLRGLLPAEQSQRVETWLVADRAQGFDLRRAPLLRLALFRTAEQEHRFVWSFPHILLDGRSFPLVLGEVFTCYDAFRRGDEPSLPHRRPYRDHIEWLRRQDFSRAAGFWRRLLDGLSGPTPLPSVPGDGEQHGRGEVGMSLSQALTTALTAFAREHGITLSTVVQGAWAILLSRWSGEEDVVFGATRACRRSALPEAEEMVGLFINTLPVRVRVRGEAPLIEWLQELRAQQVAVRPFEHTPLVDVQRWSGIAGGAPLFESIVVFDTASLNATMRALGPAFARREFELREQTTYPLTLYAYAEPELVLKLAYDRDRIADATAARLLAHLHTLLAGMADNPQRALAALPLLTAAERRRVLVEWNATRVPSPQDRCIHRLIEAQAARTPEAVALIHRHERLTYRELNARANKLARYLTTLGVGPDTLVGICTERSVDMVVAVLAVHKAGGAYLPLDPAYPRERLAFMLRDATVPVLLTQQHLKNRLPDDVPAVLCLDSDWDRIAPLPEHNPNTPVTPTNLAYVIYTSGSTGRPKGVMVEHRNVVNFFTGMDAHLTADPPGTWLAVTSLSFDISVLELLWTLARGFTVVLYDGQAEGISGPTRIRPPAERSIKQVSFSLMYFASAQGGSGGETYRLLVDGAKFADRHGFEAVWTPERHFHAFGGIFPNPAVTGAALAMVTERVHIRAGSCVLPLHSPLRVAEEWAVVDNLSRGRVGVAFASGWMPHDFVLRPERFADAKATMARDVELVRRLWRGEAVSFPGPDGREVPVRTLPRPVQPELPVWITAAGSPDTFRLAGQLGANVLTHLLGQSVDEVAEKIAIYREARRTAGHPGEGRVTLMLHTFLGEDEDAVRETVRRPMIEYLRSSLSLIRGVAASFPIFRHRSLPPHGADDLLAGLSEEETEALLTHAFERYYQTSGLFGSPERCRAMVERLRAIGVDEIACLIDFGVAPDKVLASLRLLAELKDSCEAASSTDDFSIPALIERHGVTHLQCTPSMATMLLADERTRRALRGLRQLLIGGEAFPSALAAELTALVQGDVLNMYGPTETTIWSSVQRVRPGLGGASVPIGRPIANTQLYILDKHLQPVPVGVPGELWIGGAGVARGYLNRPELTAERFLPDPFVADPAARMYRTGDLARFLPDGTIEFLGRLDHQVKIRGHRIELGEIESRLREQPGIREAVVIAREHTPGDKRLVAYVVAEAGAAPPDVAALRARLAETLPEVMVPAHIVALEALPLTPNNKVDRTALPRPGDAAPTTVAAAPRDGLEAQIAAVWREVLGTPAVGVDDNFFDVGGHSLLAVQVHRRLQAVVGPRLSLTDLFRFPTIRALAGYLSQNGEISSVQDQAAARAQARQQALARRLSVTRG